MSLLLVVGFGLRVEMSLLSVTDVVTVLKGVGLSGTTRQVRYAPVPASYRGPSGGRLYLPVDVALVAVHAWLVGQCVKAGQSGLRARVAMQYRGVEIRAGLRHRRGRWLVFDPAFGTVDLADRRHPADPSLHLPELMAQIADAIDALRGERPDVWDGTAYVDAEDAREALAM